MTDMPRGRAPPRTSPSRCARRPRRRVVTTRSLVVKPGRCQASRCACRTHFRSVSAVQPSFGATDCSTAHSEAWASRCSSTIRTARSRTSGENRLGRPIDPILPSNEASEKPGTVQGAAAARGGLRPRGGRSHAARATAPRTPTATSGAPDDRFAGGSSLPPPLPRGRV